MDLWGPFFSSQAMLSFGLRFTPALLIACGFIFSAILYLKKSAHLTTRRDRERWALSGLSALFSALYFSYYLHNTPQVIDAAFYFLEAKIFAQGDIIFPEQQWASLLNGRFTLAHAADPSRLSVLFPPGYPLLLSLFLRIGIPFACGPALAAAITFSTMTLAQRLTHSGRVSLVAGILSTGCLALRYQTSETMSHGLTCFLAIISLLLSLDAKRQSAFLFLGTILGFTISTRQLTGGALLVSAFVILAQRRSWRGLFSASIGVLLGLIPLLYYHYQITGTLFHSPQSLYYSLADAPEDCFGLGLTKGCLFEHGTAVKQQGGEGLTLLWMVRNTLHRLWWLSLDLFSCELLFPIALLGYWKLTVKKRRLGLLTWPLLLIGGYALFYFNGSIAGGGARLLAELLPLLHIGLAQQLVQRRWEIPALLITLLTFAFHGQFTHELLRSSGHHVEAQWHRKSQTLPSNHTIVTETDHGFALSYLPQNASRPPNVVRKTDHARLAEYKLLSKQLLKTRAGNEYLISNEILNFEAESAWPLTSAHAVAARPAFVNELCIGSQRGLFISFQGPRNSPQKTQNAEPKMAGYFAGQNKAAAQVCSLQLWTEARGCFKLNAIFNQVSKAGLLQWDTELMLHLKRESRGGNLLIDQLNCRPLIQR